MTLGRYEMVIGRIKKDYGKFIGPLVVCGALASPT